MVAERTGELQEANRALLRDMEQRERLQEQLRHSQKFESLGASGGRRRPRFKQSAQYHSGLCLDAQPRSIG